MSLFDAIEGDPEPRSRGPYGRPLSVADSFDLSANGRLQLPLGAPGVDALGGLAGGSPVLPSLELAANAAGGGTGRLEQIPVFALDPVQFAFPGELVAVAVSNNILAAAVDVNGVGHRLLRIDLSKAAGERDAVEEIDVFPKRPPNAPSTASSSAPPVDKVRGLHFDHFGRHLLITTTLGDVYYLFAGWKRARMMIKLRGLHVHAVSFPPPYAPPPPSPSPSYLARNSPTTGPTLLATRSGKLFEVDFRADAERGKEERYLKQVWIAESDPGSADAGEEGMGVTGVRWEWAQVPVPATGTPNTAAPSNNPAHPVAIALLSTRRDLFAFAGNVQPYHADPTGAQSTLLGVFIEDPVATLDVNPPPGSPSSQPPPRAPALSVYRPPDDAPDGSGPAPAERFAWGTQAGVMVGLLDLADSKNPLKEAEFVPYPPSDLLGTAPSTPSTQPADSNAPKPTPPTPISVLCTAVHVLLLYPRRITACSSLSLAPTWTAVLPTPANSTPTTPPALHLACDPSAGTFWVPLRPSLVELLATDERRDEWLALLQRGKFSSATRAARTEVQRRAVARAEGEAKWKEGKYGEAAASWAGADVGVEEVAVRLWSVGEKDGLRVFLEGRLEGAGKSDVIQKVLLCTWLTELYLDRLDSIPPPPPSSSTDTSHPYVAAQASLLSFLHHNLASLDVPTTFQLMQSHSHPALYLSFARLVGDWDRALAHLVSEKRWDEAVDMLTTKVPLGRAADLWYKYSAELMSERPSDTVAGWIRMGGGVNPKHLVPAMVRYDVERSTKTKEVGVGSKGDKGEAHQGVRYLRFVVDKLGNKDAVVHNYLVALYVARAGEVGEETSGILEFLRGHRTPYYDLHYALRLCSQSGLVSSCVAICQSVGLWEEAVDLALASGRVSEAEECADKARAGRGVVLGKTGLLDEEDGEEDEDTKELRRKLWLKIARHVVDEKKDIKSAIDLVKKSSDLLKLADILPFFPDFVLIDDFKDEICAALEEYNVHIERLRREMDEATRAAESIRLDVRALRNRYVVIQPNEKCYLCSDPLMLRQFYVFPCGHSFHADCLIREITKELSPRMVRRIRDLQDRITKVHQRVVQNSSTSGPGAGKPPSSAAAASSAPTPTSTSSSSAAASAQQKKNMTELSNLRDELDDVVAGECMLCGEVMIRTVDRAFVDEERESEALEAWET
ncbi:hypothetical protein M427DRAFT_56560 [Gonapodya prolifera JEL478]|uniref:Pep3/Vps18/deep orange domain-containing protein n=1 Tax=Gonapodya prolifera (strain JEL478) TaxID=1344416 RepID=A0A139AG41_GONPJ|nr:hypothetical protein M427DRAFT_56560 [Gonapodya prolifera JEL478]|eukprot:KXS15730.1 hypothetical protein M427DRAFT_56560 [Gonapodya prolifera JEL478]